VQLLSLLCLGVLEDGFGCCVEQFEGAGDDENEDGDLLQGSLAQTEAEVEYADEKQCTLDFVGHVLVADAVEEDVAGVVGEFAAQALILPLVKRSGQKKKEKSD